MPLFRRACAPLEEGQGARSGALERDLVTVNGEDVPEPLKEADGNPKDIAVDKGGSLEL